MAPAERATLPQGLEVSRGGLPPNATPVIWAWPRLQNEVPDTTALHWTSARWAMKSMHHTASAT
ncbi:hypothetical protein CTA1_7819 [Colletotrichum tanaceti]|uniref:Uncharacterized protein n=1 Tax=Colletotrichum tanaceti TaxID=1306861 RepID=A0A4V6DF54_9PEZI|nr:hypothetical protein CTA1_7819 [Colletotrichum tanaceti]